MGQLGSFPVSEAFELESDDFIQVFAIAASRRTAHTRTRTVGLRKSVESGRETAESRSYGLVDAVDPGVCAPDAMDESRHLSPVSSDRSPSE